MNAAFSYIYSHLIADETADDSEDELRSVVVSSVQAAGGREKREVKMERSGWMTKQGNVCVP